MANDSATRTARHHPEAEMNVTPLDSAGLRRALSHFAIGVTIITLCGADQMPVGLTCNSFGSVSLDPPLVLWSIAKSSRSHDLVSTAGHFAIHVLDATQGELCRKFASREADRFSGVDLEPGLHDLPLLTRYHARFECETYARHDAGDHMTVIGRVLRVCEQPGTPLIFYRSAFSCLI